MAEHINRCSAEVGKLCELLVNVFNAVTVDAPTQPITDKMAHEVDSAKLRRDQHIQAERSRLVPITGELLQQFSMVDSILASMSDVPIDELDAEIGRLNQINQSLSTKLTQLYVEAAALEKHLVEQLDKDVEVSIRKQRCKF